MSDSQLFKVKIPDKPTGRMIAVCFDSLKSQMVSADALGKTLTRININKQEKQIEIEVKGGS